MNTENTKHTPGPWEIKDGAILSVSDWGVRDAELVANLSCYTLNIMTEEGKANARLIAAAPELLAALEAVLSRLDNAAKTNPVYLRNVREEARAAIAKAKGE